MKYDEFLAAKAQLANAGGFEPEGLPEHLFDFQRAITEWAVRQGRAAIFADCGMGKTPMALAWADQVYKHTGKPVLLLTPLAVGQQIAAEADKFGHDAALSRTGKSVAPITITNYEQLSKFEWSDYGGVVCDESSIWDDIRMTRTLPFQPDPDDEDAEKHVHPLQLDVIERFVDLRTMPGERVLTPFMGVGSEVFTAARMGRYGIGAELKPSYYRQAVANLSTVDALLPDDPAPLFEVSL